MTRAVKITLIVTSAAFVLAGCGVRGNLEPPPQAAVEQQSSATAESGQGKPAGKAARPHKTFILDGLIQ